MYGTIRPPVLSLHTLLCACCMCTLAYSALALLTGCCSMVPSLAERAFARVNMCLSHIQTSSGASGLDMPAVCQSLVCSMYWSTLDGGHSSLACHLAWQARSHVHLLPTLTRHCKHLLCLHAMQNQACQVGCMYKAGQATPCPVQAASGHMRTISVMAMKFTLVDGAQPVDAHLPQLMPDMLNHIQDQDRYACTLLLPAYCTVLASHCF